MGNGLSCESRNRYSLHAILDHCHSIIGDQSRSYGLHSTISYSLDSDTFTDCPKHTYEPKYLQMLYFHVLVTISISHTIEEPEQWVYCWCLSQSAYSFHSHYYLSYLSSIISTVDVLSFSIYQPLYTRPAIYFCLLQIILSYMRSSDSINGRTKVSYLPAQTVWKRCVISYITSGLE